MTRRKPFMPLGGWISYLTIALVALWLFKGWVNVQRHQAAEEYKAQTHRSLAPSNN